MSRLGIGLAYGAVALAVALLGGYLAVSLVVEKASEVEVPAVIGLPLSEALDRLSDRGLDLEVRAFVYSDEVPENRIVRQHPAEGQVVREGRGIGVVLSRGPERHAVPDVRGISLDDARIRLGEAALRPVVAARIPRGPEGEVIGQGVHPGRRLASGTPVALLVSTGPAPKLWRMPRLERLPLGDAVAALDALGLRVGRVEEVRLEDPSREGLVASQDPLPGFPVARGEEVVLSVAGSARTLSFWRDAWVVRHFPPGYSRHHVEVTLTRGEHSWTLADEWVAGGGTFRRWIPWRPGEVVRVRIDGEDEWETRTGNPHQDGVDPR